MNQPDQPVLSEEPDFPEPDLTPTDGVPVRPDGASKAHRWQWLIVGLIVIGAGAVRLSRLDREGVWLDEYRQVSTYSLPFVDAIVYSLHWQRQVPLDYAIGWLVYRFNQSDFAIRLPAAVFGTAGVFLLYLLARRLGSTTAAMLAAAFLALSPLHLRYSQEARPYAIFVFFYIATLYTLAVAWQRNTWRSWLVFTITGALLLLSRSLAPVVVFGVICPVALVLCSRQLWRERRAGQLRRSPPARLLCCTVLLALLYVPVIALLVHYERQMAYSLLWKSKGSRLDQPLMLFQQFFLNIGGWFESLRYALQSGWQIKLPFLVAGLVWTLARLPRYAKVQQVILLAMLIAGPVYLLVFSALVEGTILQRYLVFLTPLYAMLLAFGLIEVGLWLIGLAATHVPAGQRLWIVACSALVVISGGYACLAWLQTYTKPQWRECAEFLNDRLQPGDAIFVFQDRRFGRAQRPFIGDRYLTDPPEICDSIWQFVRNEERFALAMSAPAHGQAYLVLHYYGEPWYRDQKPMSSLRITPAGVRLRKFRRLDLLWFEDPHRDVWQQLFSFSHLMLTGEIGQRLGPSRRSHIMLLLLRAWLRAEHGQPFRALTEYRQAERICPPDKWDYFLHNTQGLRKKLDVEPAWQPAGR